MTNAATTTYLNIESIGADKLIASMSGLQKSMNFVGGMLRDLNKGLGILPQKAKASDSALKSQAASASEAMAAANQLRVAMVAQNAATTSLADSVAKLTTAQKSQAQNNRGMEWVALKSKLDLAKQGYDLVKGALVKVGGEALRVSQAWDTQRTAEERLSAAMKASGIGENIADMKDWASAVQSATMYGDEQVLTLASQAAKFSQNGELTKRATEAALDFASATGADATSAINTIGRAMQGNARSLQQLGIYLTDTEAKRLKEADAAEKQAFILGKLEAQYKNAAEAMAMTPTGALKQAQNILSDIDEEVGKLVSPAMYAGLSVVRDYLSGQKDEVRAITGQADRLKQSQDRLLVGLATAGGVLIDLKTGVVILKNSVEVAVQGIIAAMTAGLKPIGEAVQLMAKLPGLGEGARNTFSSLGAAIAMPFDASVEGIKGDVDDIKKAIADAAKQKDQLWNDLERSRDKMAATKYTQGTGQRGPGADTLSLTKKEQEAEAISFEMALDRETAAFLAAENKKIEIAQEYTEKRMALEASQLIDYQTKLDQKKQLDIQEEEALRQVKIEYAKATGDLLTVVEDQYRQDRLAKDKAAEEELKKEREATMASLANNIKGVTGLGVDMLTSWIEGTGDWRSQLYDAMKSFSVNLMKTSIASIIDQALVNQAKAQGSQAGIPIVGPILALAAGAAMFATTMALKSKLKPAAVEYATGGYISAGMVKGGAWGRDSVPALLEPGERVLSKTETKAYDNGQNSQKNVVININISGQLSTPEQVRDTVRRVLVPELRAAARAGYAI